MLREARHSVLSLLACGSLPSKQGVPLISDADALDIVLKRLLPAHGILASVTPIPAVVIQRQQWSRSVNLIITLQTMANSDRLEQSQHPSLKPGR
jgi:hypothetical protein